MNLRDELVRAGVPERDVDRVLRHIDMASSTRTNIWVEPDKVVFETVVGDRRRVEVELRQLWDTSHGPPLNGNALRRKLAPLRRATGDDISDDEVAAAERLEWVVGTDLETLASLLLVESIKGFGPQKFKELYEAGVSPRELAERPDSLPTGGKRGDDFKRAISQFTVEDEDLARRRAARQIVRAQENDARIVTFDDPNYPENVWESNNPIPILYVQGSASVLRERSNVACVGSRKIRAPYDELLDQFAHAAVDEDFGVVSGFALGADTIAHHAAFEAGGRTVAVMPCGLDRPFPPENRAFWEDLRRYPPAVFVSEFPFGTAASGLTLRKRNKLIVAFALGVLVAQSAANGGAMNAYRFALEQRKPAASFEPDLQGDTSGNALIIEEAARRQVSLAAPVEARLPAGRDPQLWREWLHALLSST